MKEVTTVSTAITDLSDHRSLHHRVDCAPPSGNGTDARQALGKPARLLRVGVVPLVFELYDSVAPDLRAKLQQFFNTVMQGLRLEQVEFTPCELVSTLSHLTRVCESFANQELDAIVIAHLSYVPSGQLLAALQAIDTPILLWPAQPMEEIEAAELTSEDVFLNHSVHGTMDLANMLRRAERPYGVIHGHWKKPAFQRELLQWCQASAMLQTLRRVNPLVLGDRFPDMLDLRLENEPFMKKLGTTPHQVAFSEFIELQDQIPESAVLELCEAYREQFDIDPSLDGALLMHSAKNELVLRRLLEKYESQALAVNFLDVCREPKIADALHLPVSRLMSEGIGYGAEADWETASMVAAMQTVFGNDQVGFTEIFSVDYGKNRVLLRHWGEGNITQAARKPKIVPSVLNHIGKQTRFPICDFQFRPGRYTLLNLSVTPQGQGQLIAIPGQIEGESMPKCDGVRSLFKADCTDVQDLLNRYAKLGGSHHLVLIQGDATAFIEKLAQQAGWVQLIIK